MADETATAVLRRVSPVWAWLRENFKLPAVLAIGGTLVGASSWIWSQHADLVELRGKLKGLATAHQVDELNEKISTLLERVANQGERLERLERNWDEATRVAGEPIPRAPRKGPTGGKRGVTRPWEPSQ